MDHVNASVAGVALDGDSSSKRHQTSPPPHCPEDVWHCIMTFMAQADLRNLCLVNTSLRNLAEPYLYSDIHLVWPGRLIKGRRDNRPHCITLLIGNILRRPHLSPYIRSVSLIGASFRDPFYQGRAPKVVVAESDLSEALAFVAKTGVPYRELWSQELRNGTMEAFIAVLLAQPLRLTDLSMGHDFFKESQLVGVSNPGNSFSSIMAISRLSERKGLPTWKPFLPRLSVESTYLLFSVQKGQLLTQKL